MNLIPNPGRVLARASSMWAVYGGLLILLVDKAPELLNGPGADKLISPEWRDRLLGLCLILAPVLRIIQQQSLSGPPAAPKTVLKE